MLFFWSAAGQVDMASASCALGTAVVLAMFFWGGTSGPFVWASLRPTAVSLSISRADRAGRCPGLALWPHSQGFGSYTEGWGWGRRMGGFLEPPCAPAQTYRLLAISPPMCLSRELVYISGP